MWRALTILALFVAKGEAQSCVPYVVQDVPIACICNATYCDDTVNLPTVGLLNDGYYWYQTNKAGLRLNATTGTISSSPRSPANLTLTIDRTKKYQPILGFGGAFTDSTGINIDKLSPATQAQLLRTYFDQETGSKYNLGRFPIAGTDFSVRPYSYDDVENDTALKYFSLAPEDYKYKIPFAQKALEMNPDLMFFGSSWSSPGWMKTSGQFAQFGFLKPQYYQTYAEYLAKFAEEYKKHGLNIWAITTGNEPTIALQLNTSNVISVGWTPPTMAEWVAENLGPTLASSHSPETKVIALDDDRVLLPWFVQPLYNNEKASEYTIGTGVHWYFGFEAPYEVLDVTHDLHPDKFLLLTEASQGPSFWGSSTFSTDMWNLGERYILSIIAHLRHWSVGWVDWNLVLDEAGGPTWINNTLNAPIVVDPSNDSFYKLPMYYAIAHFSKFVERHSTRIAINESTNVKAAAFTTPKEEVVVVLYNTDNSSVSVSLEDAVTSGTIEVELSPNSMNTIVYKQ